MSIGANSLDMVKIQNELVKELKIDVSVVDIFAHASVRSLSRFISGEDWRTNRIVASSG